MATIDTRFTVRVYLADEEGRELAKWKLAIARFCVRIINGLGIEVVTTMKRKFKQ